MVYAGLSFCFWARAKLDETTTVLELPLARVGIGEIHYASSLLPTTRACLVLSRIILRMVRNCCSEQGTREQGTREQGTRGPRLAQFNTAVL